MFMHLCWIMTLLAELGLRLLDEEFLGSATVWFVAGCASTNVRVAHFFLEEASLMTSEAGLGNLAPDEECLAAPRMWLMTVQAGIAVGNGCVRERQLRVARVIFMARGTQSDARCHQFCLVLMARLTLAILVRFMGELKGQTRFARAMWVVTTGACAAAHRVTAMLLGECCVFEVMTR